MTVRKTGTFVASAFKEEEVRAFVPLPLPPKPKLAYEGELSALHDEALQNCRLLNVAAQMVLDRDWFIYGFVRREAVVSSQIEGTQATLLDVLEAETRIEAKPDEVSEVINYVKALNDCLAELANPKGLPLSLRLLKKAHAILMRGVRGEKHTPGEFRNSQNWIGGSRPGNAKFVPPPPGKLSDCLNELENYFHAKSDLPPLVRAGMIHVQFETIHPFLDGNGRVGRLLIILLLMEWKILESPLLYLSIYFKENRQEYYDQLTAVRANGDWEGWTKFYLTGVRDVAAGSADLSRTLYQMFNETREKVLSHKRASVAAIRLLDALPRNPLVTAAQVTELLSVTKPTAQKAIELLIDLKVLKEISGKERGRVFSFEKYVSHLMEGMEPLSS